MFAGLAACGGVPDENEEVDAIATETSALGASCTFLRPFGWHGTSGALCVENEPVQTTVILDGRSLRGSGGHWSPDAWGRYRVTCVDGQLVVASSFCNYGVEP